jgi:hypothetical protein
LNFKRKLNLATKNGKIIEVQVGKAKKDGKPIARERQAIQDIKASPTYTNSANGSRRVIFAPYNR